MTEQGTEVQVVTKEETMLSVSNVVSRVNAIHDILTKVMKAGTHYGTIPGCGNKNVLYKPGADLLAMTFRLVPQFAVERTDLDAGHREFNVTCSMYTPGGVLVGQGVGSASTMEKKYRYRKDGSGTRTENDCIADTYNTVLKIAKKRAHIDCTLTCTGAADMFTQDYGDVDDDDGDKAPIRQPQATQPAAAPKPPASGNPVVVGVVEEVALKQSKEGVAKPWSKWGVKVGGKWYSTFDRPRGEMAVTLEGREARIEYTVDGKYNNIVDIAYAAAAAPDPDQDGGGANGAQEALPL